MNPILILTHNNLDLTQKCVDSAARQDCGDLYLAIIDNHSTDGTKEWLSYLLFLNRQFNFNGIEIMCWMDNKGVSRGWNAGLNNLFYDPDVEHVLVINNDVVLPPMFYSEMLKRNVPFVTGAAVEEMESIAQVPIGANLTVGANFSAFLIRREAWEKVGPFDERMKFYAQDCDYDIRAHQLGITLWNAHVHFYHERSSTLRLASPEEKAAILQQANKDREVFRQKWNCLPGTKEYSELLQSAVC